MMPNKAMERDDCFAAAAHDRRWAAMYFQCDSRAHWSKKLQCEGFLRS